MADTAAPQPQPQDTWIAILIGGALAGGVYLISKARTENPLSALQTVTVSVNGRQVPFRISTDGDEWEASTQLQIGRRKSRIKALGTSKSEVLQAAIAKASAAFASADVR